MNSAIKGSASDAWMFRDALVKCGMFLIVFLVLCGGLQADIIYTKDGEAHYGIIRRRNEMGVSVQLVDGRQKFFRNEEIERIDDTNKDVQVYTAAAGSLNLEKDGGLGYYYLGRWCEERKWNSTALGIYKVALVDEESAPLAAQALLRIRGMDDTVLRENGLMAALYSPLFGDESLQHLEEVREAVKAREEGLDKNAVNSFYSIVSLIGNRRFSTAYRDWEKSHKSWDTSTARYLEEYLRAYTGYDVQRLEAELIFISTRGKGAWECEKCRGTGKVKCPRCDGRGYFTCDRCNGRGYITKRRSSQTSTHTFQQKCPKCRGRGYDICSVCGRYKEYYHDTRIRSGGGSSRLKVSGYVPCPDCRGSGRSPDAPDEVITFSALKTGEMQARFRSLAKQLYSSLIVEGDHWGSQPVPFKNQPQATVDPGGVASMFYRHKWFTAERIEEMKKKKQYKEPEIEKEYYQKYLSEIGPMVSDIWSSVAEPLSGKDLKGVSSAASYFLFYTNAAIVDTLEKRKVFTSTFRNDGGNEDRIAAPGEFVLYKGEKGGIRREYRVVIDSSCFPDDFRAALDGSEEVRLFYSISACRERSEETEDAVEHSFVLTVTPYLALITSGTGTSRYVRTARSEEAEF